MAQPTFLVLGPLAVRVEGRTREPASPSQRRLLAGLLLARSVAVSTDRLADQVWPQLVPSDPAAALRTQVSRLRRWLAPLGERLVTTPTGYRLDTHPGEVDADCFEELLHAAREPSERGVALVDAGLGLWRGRAFETVTDLPDAHAEAVRLDELREVADERRAEMLLALGRPEQAVAALEALCVTHPDRERVRALLMEGLYRTGRHTAALQVYRSWRRYLAVELGVEPSRELRALEQQVLQHRVPGRSPAGPGAALPLGVTSLVGRETDLAALEAALGASRTITLTGPGGVGKTRLALEVATRVQGRYPGGVRLVDLAAVRRSRAVLRAVATAVGVAEKGDAPLVDQIASRLAGSCLLLLLDNCEHVTEAVGRVVERLVRSADRVDLLVTSRERLGAAGEQVWPVRPLPVGGPESPAVQLFLDRAAKARPEPLGPAELARAPDLCARLDGLPLAIELAAAQLGSLTVPELLDALHDRFTLLTAARGVESRHRSLAGVVSWSYERLTPAQQQVFERLAVFAGPADLADCRAVAAGEGLPEGAVDDAVRRLVDLSLLSAERPGEHTSYRMLETLRDLGMTRLRETGRLDAARARHGEWAVDLAARTDRGLRGPDEAVWVETLRSHYDDLRAAHAWLVGADLEAALELSDHLHWYAVWRMSSEIYRWAEVAAAAAGDSASPRLPAVLGSVAVGAAHRGDLAAAAAAGRRALALAAQAGIASRRRAFEGMGEVALLTGDLDACARLEREAYRLSTELGDDFGATWDLGSVALAELYAGRLTSAVELLPQVRRLAGSSGSPSARAFAAFVAGEVAGNSSDPDRAREELQAALDLAEGVDARLVSGIARVSLATLYARHDDPATALRYYQDVIPRWRRAGAWTAQWVTLRTLVDLLERCGAAEEAATLLGAVAGARSGAAPYGHDARLLGEVGDRLRDRLGDRAFRRCTDRGSALPEDEVLDLALSATARVRAALHP